MKTAVPVPAVDVESLVAEAADRFTDDVKQGLAPRIEDYAERYPEIATIIRQVFPSLTLLDASVLDPSLAPSLLPASGEGPEEGVRPGILGDFRILRELGRGGMGVVYEAEQISLGRHVALKVLPFAAMLDKQQLNRFKNEARAAATLDHPNIVAIHSVGVERGVHYYAMQLIEGESLAQVIARLRKESGVRGQESVAKTAPFSPKSEIINRKSEIAPPPDTAPVAALSTLHAPRSSPLAPSSREYFRTIARLGVQAAEALDHAHQNGILHRDVKPANLMVEWTGDCPLLRSPASNTSRSKRGLSPSPEDDAYAPKLWITDFGLARIEQDAGMTMTGDLLGTLRYMSPEQALAKRVVVDHRSDVYSLGATLYELLTLQPPFDGDDRQELLRQIAFDEPKSPRQTNSSIPADLETIVLKAIEKNPAQRYATAEDLAADLRRFLDNEPIKAKPPTRRERALKWAARHPAALRATMLFLVASTLISAGSVLAISAALRREAASSQQALNAAVAERRATEAEAVQRRRAEAINGFLIDAFRTTGPGKDGRSITAFEILERAANQLQSSYNDDPQTKAALADAMGDACHSLEIYDKEAALRELALELRVATLGPDHPESLKSLNGLCIAYWTSEQFERLLPRAEELVRRRTMVLGRDNPETLHARIFVVVALSVIPERQDEALDLLEETLDRQTVVLGPQHKDTVRSMCRLAQIYFGIGRAQEAISLLEKVIAQDRAKSPTPSGWYITWAIGSLANVYSSTGRTRDALPLYEELVEVNAAAEGPTSSPALRALNWLAEAHLELGNDGRAASVYERALALERSERLAIGRSETLETVVGLVRVHFEQGNAGAAVGVVRGAIDLVPNNAELCNQLAWWLATAPEDDVRDGPEAVRLAEKACELTNYSLAVYVDTLAAAHAETGDFDAARKWSQKAVELAADDNMRTELSRHLDSYKSGLPWREDLTFQNSTPAPVQPDP